MSLDLHRWASLFGDLVGEALSPSACSACDARTRKRSVFCVTCAATVVREVPESSIYGGDGSSLDLWAFGGFGGALATAIRRLKYAGRSDLARPLGELLRRLVTDRRVRADLVVPVPIHPRRLVTRGYNQAALLAARVARDVGASLSACALRRVRQGATQVGLQRHERAGAVRGAFVVRADVRDKRVLLVDDVVTTGATLSECATTLRARGATWVGGVVLARTELA